MLKTAHTTTISAVATAFSNVVPASVQNLDTGRALGNILYTLKRSIFINKLFTIIIIDIICISS